MGNEARKTHCSHKEVMKQGRLIVHTRSYNVTMVIVHTRSYNANNG
ncbi:hypothetical protein KSS87_002541 [Heliosperma pusillum]|nr:hypothetical protein KSS87_002541 [Heliosperma pusillum]